MTEKAKSGDVVILGVGQLRNNRERSADNAVEPLELMRRTLGTALCDAGLPEEVLTRLDAVEVVQIVSWSYENAARALADRIGAEQASCTVSQAGGHQPVSRLGALAARIAAGESRFALLAGGEAQSSLEMLRRGEHDIPWSRRPGGPGEFSREVGGTERMWELGLVGPVRVYPLFENRLRYELGQSFEHAQDWSARMYAEFSAVASTQEAAWNPQVRSAEEIRTVGEKNRMICFPYPLLMNATAKVDQASAILVASAEFADELGVADEHRVHVLSASEDADCDDVLERPSHADSPGMHSALDGALAGAGLTATEVDLLDLYSCFPVVPKIAALHLKATDRALSTIGGLTSFGGPHNNYSSHALATVTTRLRSEGGERARNALVYANGEYVTKHAAVVLSNSPGRSSYSYQREATHHRDVAAVDDSYLGEAVVDTHTVEFDRDGAPVRGFVLARTPSGARTGLRVSKSDTPTLHRLVATEQEAIEALGHVVSSGDGRRYFTFRPVEERA